MVDNIEIHKWSKCAALNGTSISHPLSPTSFRKHCGRRVEHLEELKVRKESFEIVSSGYGRAVVLTDWK